MNGVNAICKRCGKHILWYPGAPRICQRCWIRLQAKGSNIKAKVKSK